MSATDRTNRTEQPGMLSGPREPAPNRRASGVPSAPQGARSVIPLRTAVTGPAPVDRGAGDPLERLLDDIDDAHRAETSRMLPACTICGWPTDRVPTPAEWDAHMTHPTPKCGDCWVALDLWPCDTDCRCESCTTSTIPFTRCGDCTETDVHSADCPQLPLAEVEDFGRNRWMVASASTPYAYVPVRLIHVGGASVLDCPCPYGARLAEMDLAERNARRGCRHQIAVVRYQNQTSRRPSMPCVPSAWVD